LIFPTKAMLYALLRLDDFAEMRDILSFAALGPDYAHDIISLRDAAKRRQLSLPILLCWYLSFRCIPSPFSRNITPTEVMIDTLLITRTSAHYHLCYRRQWWRYFKTFIRELNALGLMYAPRASIKRRSRSCHWFKIDTDDATLFDALQTDGQRRRISLDFAGFIERSPSANDAN